MKNLMKFLKTTGIYLIGNVLTKAIAFLMLPIYTKYLSPVDYGTYDLNIAYITFLSSVLFLDIWSGMMRFMFDYSDREEKNKPILSGILIFSVSTVVYTIFSIALGSIMNIDYLAWVLLYGLFANLQQLFAYIIRGIGKNTLFAMAGLVGSIVTMSCNIIFIAIFKEGYQYLYISSVLGAILNIIILMFGFNIVDLFRKENYSFKLTKEIFLFSLPLTVNSVSWWFLTAFNRVIVSNRLSIADNGLYAVANKFTSIMQLVDQAFQMAWQEISFEKSGANKADNSKFFSTAINEYIKFMTIGVAIILPIIKIAFPYFINSTFSSAINIIPLALVATLMSSISTFLGGTITAIKKNKYLFTTTLSGTVVNIIIVLLSIGTLGVQSASLALGIGFLVVDIRRYILLKKHLELALDVKTIVLSFVILSISMMVYISGNIVWNLIDFILVIIVMLSIYKEFIIKIISRRNN